jgi:hypothetical protein
MTAFFFLPWSEKIFSLQGKKKKVVIVCLAALLVFGIIGCRTTRARDIGYKSSILMGTGNSGVVVKDFEPLEIVFAETSASRRNGYGTTYDSLMKEAAKKGADAIINVSITPTSGVFTKTWSGSALAIKYLETVPGETPVIGRTSAMGEIANTALLARSGRSFGRGRF